MKGKNKFSAAIRSNFNKLPNDIFKMMHGVSPGAKLVFIYMLSESEDFHPGQAEIAEKLEMSQSAVSRYLDELVGVGFLKITYQAHRHITQFELNLYPQEDTNDDILHPPADTKSESLYPPADTIDPPEDTIVSKNEVLYPPADTQYPPVGTTNTNSNTPQEERKIISQDAKSEKLSGESSCIQPPYGSFVKEKALHTLSNYHFPKTEDPPMTVEKLSKDLEKIAARKNEKRHL